MKKIIFTLLAFVGTMSMNAQIVKPGMEIMKNGVVVATYTADQADEVVFKEVTPPTTGTEKRTGGVSVNWVQLWENGPKFAEYNVGATSATEYGGYYAWGGNQNKVDDHNTGTVYLSGDDDTATKLWGDKWRMPTKEELDALLNNQNCTCTWTTQNGVNGLLCTGKGDYKDNSVFLPAAGFCDDGGVYGQGDYGRYWSSTPDDSYYAYDLYFNSGGQYVDYDYRGSGCSVRAVLNENK